MENNNKTIYIFLAIATIMFLTVGGTLAYFTWVTNSSQNTAVSFTTTAGLSCSADGGGNITSSNTQLAPATCLDTEHAIQRTITTSVTNSNEGSAYMSLNLKVNQMASELAASENFKYAITTNANSCTTGVLKTGTFTGATTNSTFPILEDAEYQTSGSGTYYLYIWLDEAESNNNTQNKTFNLSLTGVCTNHVSTIGDTLSQNAVLDNTTSTYVTNANGVQFNAISSDTNGKGLYIRAGTENDAHPIYYYRGAVTDNNVLFGGFCWKIVRTTSTGGTKLIYNGTPTGTNSNECNNTGTASQLSTTSKFNNNSNSPADVGYMYGTRYERQSQTMTSYTDTYMYGTGYDENNHRLVTTNAMNFAGTDWGTYYNQLSNNHYTCFNTSGECNQVYYIYYTTNTIAYYVQIPSGKTISGMLDEMLTSSSNTYDSTIKAAIDTWYAANMTSYTNKLEDTPYCNDRTIYQLNGWNPNGGSTTSYLYFNAYGRTQSPYTPSLTCNTNDAFTVSASTGNGKLTYSVGLLTADEIRLAGGEYNATNSTYYLYTNQYWWSGSPYYFLNDNAFEFRVTNTGNLNTHLVHSARGVRPAVSLKPGTKFSSGGDGTSTNPYVVE